MQPAQSLRALFAFVELYGGGTFWRIEIEQALGGGPEAAALLRALLRTGLVSKAPYAVGLPCPEQRRDCKEVSIEQRSLGGKGCLVAVCGARRRRCEDLLMERETYLGRITISFPDLARLTRRLFWFDGHADLDRQGLCVLGEEEVPGSDPRDVYLACTAEYAGFEGFLEGLEHARRASLVFVPTGGALRDALRKAHGPGSRVEVDFLADRLVLRDGQIVREDAGDLSLVAEASYVARLTPISRAPAPVTLIMDCTRSKRCMFVIANGERIKLQDQLFALLVKLVDIHLRNPNTWTKYKDLDIHRVRGVTWHTNRAFDAVVPAGFEVVVIDGKRQCMLNPAVVVERIDWRTVAAHPDPEVKKVAEIHLEA